VAPRDGSDAVARFVEDFGSALVDSGIPRMPARVFACLLASAEGRLTAAELGERLRASAAGISGAVRYLIQVNLVTRTRDPGSRRDVYVVEHEVFYRAMASRDGDVSRWIDRLGEGIAAVGPDTEAAARLADLRDFLEFLLGEMTGLFERWEQHKRDRVAGPGCEVS
jgi:DNA-binding transcriptional regulator GbsR (MarR family)